MNAASVIILIILLIGLFRPLTYITSWMFIVSVFSSLSLLPPEALGGSSITPGAFAGLIFIMKGLTTRGALQKGLQSMLSVRQLGFLGLFLLVAVPGAFILPSIFNGSISVIPMRTPHLEMLALTTANYTQTAYIIISCLTAMTACAHARDPGFVDALLKAILLGAFAAIASGFLDMGASMAGISLDYFRTANYTFMTEGTVLDSRRVIGLTPEASAYGSMAGGFGAMLLFLRPVYPPHLWRRYVPIAAWGCLGMAFMSKSSTAFVMIGITLALYLAYSAYRLTADNKVIRKTALGKGAMLVMLAVMCVPVLLFDSNIANYFLQTVDTLIFQKQYSSSYMERSFWTATAFDAFLASGGLGVGLGSVRTSNFFVNILASTGAIGGLFFGLFLAIIFTRSAPRDDQRANIMIQALKLTLLPLFAAAMLAGTTPDFGSFNGLIFGLIAGLSQAERVKKWISPLAKPQPAVVQSKA